MHAVSFNLLWAKVRQILWENVGDPSWFEPSFRLSIARFQSQDIRAYTIMSYAGSLPRVLGEGQQIFDDHFRM